MMNFLEQYFHEFKNGHACIMVAMHPHTYHTAIFFRSVMSGHNSIIGEVN
jgi:hypothetical protein